ncbi:MAG: 50S ribosomal protein L21 [Parcubacteria group bacterium]
MTIAIIKTGGKQYKVTEGQVLNVEKLAGNPGDKIEFNEVLLIADDKGEAQIGQPKLDKAVTAEVVEQGRADKIIVLKFKSKVRYRRKAGHRQLFTKVKITAIGGAASEKKEETKKPAKKKVAKKK